MEAFAHTATEAAKLIGMLLMHSGKLRAFDSGSESEVINVKNDEVHVEFLAWYCLRKGRYEIKLQSRYVRRVRLSTDIALYKFVCFQKLKVQHSCQNVYMT
jgi:hypothetical protein